MIPTKIRLSPSELELAQNAEIILTKNRVLQKTKNLLEDIQGEQQVYIQKHNIKQEHLFATPPKISKGENYLGLPYLVLDYPRVFGQTDIFAIRTMFWWGHFFSCSLQLSGKYKMEFLPYILLQFNQLQKKHFYIGIHENAWHHHFGEENLKPIKEINEEEWEFIVNKQPYIKLAAKWPLNDWPFAANELFSCWTFFLDLCRLRT